MTVPTEPGYYWARKDGDLPEDARVVYLGPAPHDDFTARNMDQPEWRKGDLRVWEIGETICEAPHVYFEWSERIPNALAIPEGSS